jgi:hypothetical protein
MLTLHIKALSGPRPVTASAVRELLAGGRIEARSQVLSLDCGHTWIAVEDALAVIDRLSVADADVDAAMAGGKTLHPIAMPVGGMAIALLIAGIGFGGGPAATVITATPVIAGVVAVELASVGAQGVGAGASAVVQMATAGWSACLTAGCLPPGLLVPDMPGEADPVVATSAVELPSADGSALQASWTALVADHGDEASWKEQADKLGDQTIANGIAGWTVTIAQAEPISSGQVKAFPKATKALRFAELVAAKDEAGGSVLIMSVIEDQALADILDTAAKELRPVRVTAEVDKAQYEPSNRTVVLNGYVRAIE